MKSFKFFTILMTIILLTISIPVYADVISDSALDYETELSKFPSDYQSLLKELHEDHPNWIFVARDTGLDWDDVVAGESKNDRSLLRSYNNTLLLSKDSADYNASEGKYVIYDGTSSVNANDAAIAYFADPRNYLTEKSIFAMELLSYDASAHTLDAVEAILSGTDLADKIIEYIDTNGNTITLEMTYGEAILAAGAENGVSPLMLASRIRQETSGNLSYGSISGNYSYNGTSYQGYYNFFNIKANSSSTGAAVANGLTYAKGSGDYNRPWNTPVRAISGGAEYIASGYINVGQNTNYFQKFNTVNEPYYGHQYMQTIYAVMSEAASTYSAYSNYGMLDEQIVFSIPVYDNMPARSGSIVISKDICTGTTTTGVNMRKGPGTSYSKVTTIPANAVVTVSGGIFTDDTDSVNNKLNNPYWFKVTYNGNTGYITSTYLKMDTAFTINSGSTKTLTLSKSLSGENVYYQTENPAIATVNSNGAVTGVSAGECMIYAYSSSGKMIDAVGIEVSGTTEEPDTPEETLETPELNSADNKKDSIFVSWNAVTDAEGYEIYRKDSSSTEWTKIGSVTSGSTTSYTDTEVASGTTYSYTVTAYKGEVISEYDTTGVSTVYLSEPVLSTSSTANSATVSWSKVEGAQGYYVYMKNDSGQWNLIETIKDGATLTYTKTGLNASTSYTFTVKAYYDSYNSTFSDGITVKTAEPTYTTYKTTTGVNYRNGAGTSYSKVGTLTKGTTIQVEDGYSVEANGYTWYRFKYNSGIYYIASNYLTKVTTSTPDTPGTTTPAVTYTKYKTTTVVNYRTGAGTSYSKKGKLAAGTVIEVEDGYSKSANGYTWYRFKYNSGTYYIASNYLTKVTTSTPDTPGTTTPAVTYTTYKTTTNVNYRTGAGTSYSKKGTLTKGTTIQVEDGYSKSANGYTWYRFKYNSGTYYIASSYLTKVTESTSDTPGTTTTVTYTKYKTTTGVNYRSGAGTSYGKKGTLSKGTVIQVENGYSKSANGYTWYRFKYNSGTYYIASEYLTKVQ